VKTSSNDGGVTKRVCSAKYSGVVRLEPVSVNEIPDVIGGNQLAC